MTASVRSESAAVSRMAANWPMIRALIGGTSAMREAGEELLPRWPNEEQASYNARLAVATLYPAFARTVEVMAGKPFSKAMTLSEDMPEGIREWCENIDLEGRNLHAFCADRLRECIGYGVSGILVDYPQASDIKTRADEVAAGVRPFFTAYGPGNVLGWRYKTIRGVKRLTMLRLLESVTEDDGDFGEKTVEQVRVLVPGAWSTWREAKAADGTVTWVQHEEGVTTPSAIPFVFLYGERVGFGIGKPPLLELAHQNVEHWQSGSDQQTILHVARVPILTIIGADDATITVGASTAVKLPMGASMSFVEHSGAAIAAGRQALVDLDEQMRATGAELLVQKPGAVTATQVSSENEANKCALQRIAEAFEDAINQALEYLALWVGEAESGEVELFKDYGAGSLSDASAQLLVTMQQGGIITKATVINEQKRRGVLSPDLNADDELDQVSAEGPSLGVMSSGDANSQ